MIIRRKRKTKEQLETQKRDIQWSKDVRSRDNWACSICGSNERTNAHHIIPREIKAYKYHIDNGICLCVNHHKFSRDISAHNNGIAFSIWLVQNRPELYQRAYERTMEMLNNGLNTQYEGSL